MDYRDNMPAVNVKVYDTREDILRMAREIEAGNGDYGPGPGFAAYVEALDDEKFQAYWDAASEHEMEYLEEWCNSDDDAIFPSHYVTLYQTGRSGGWLTVDGLPDDDEWSDELRAGWERFATIARELADGVSYQALGLIHCNAWQEKLDREAEDREAEREIAEAQY